MCDAKRGDTHSAKVDKTTSGLLNEGIKYSVCQVNLGSIFLWRHVHPACTFTSLKWNFHFFQIHWLPFTGLWEALIVQMLLQLLSIYVLSAIPFVYSSTSICAFVLSIEYLELVILLRSFPKSFKVFPLFLIALNNFLNSRAYSRQAFLENNDQWIKTSAFCRLSVLCWMLSGCT